MLWLAASVALMGLLVALAYFVPLSLSSSVQVRAEPSGSWAIAWGLGFGPLALSAIAAASIAPFLTCHLFGRQLVRVPLSRWTRGKAKSESEQRAAPRRRLSRAEHSVARFVQSLDPVATVLSWWEKERVLRVRSLVIDLDYSFRDVALTGRILAALCVLSALLPEHWQVNQTPSWDSEDRILLVADGRFRLWLGRLLVDLVGFVLNHKTRMRQRVEPANE